MATKLKNLRVKKVDFVDAGANPDADIKLFKRNDPDNPSAKSGKRPGAIRSLLDAIGKAVGLKQEEIEEAMEKIKKDGHESFGEKLNEIKNRKIADEIWDLCFALQYSLCSAAADNEVDSAGTAAAMKENLKEFLSVMQSCIPQWSEGKEADIAKKRDDIGAWQDVMETAVEKLNDVVRAAGTEVTGKHGLKGEAEEMKIDKSKLTDAERAFLESIEKRYGTDDGVNTSVPVLPPEVPDSSGIKKAEGGTSGKEQEKDGGADGDIYKGLHPAVKAELESLKKFREEAEDRELAEVAKRYEIIGKKKEELVPLFKSLKEAGGTAYNDMIALLDQTVAAVEKSGAFSEIGKSGHGSGTAGAAEAKIETIAKGYMEKDSSLDYASAVAKAWEDNPDLMDEYEAEAGF